MNGFADAITIKSIDMGVIAEIEKFTQTDLPGILEQKEKDCEIDRSIFYGNIHKFDPAKFHFTPGERVQLTEVAKYLTKQFDEHNDDFNTNFGGKTKKRSGIHLVLIPELGFFFPNLVSSNKAVLSADDCSSYQTKLHKDIVRLLESSGHPHSAKFTSEMATISTNAQGNTIGKIRCIFCEGENEHTISSKIDGYKIYWTLSNYICHLEKDHNIVKEKRNGPNKGQKNDRKKKGGKNLASEKNRKVSLETTPTRIEDNIVDVSPKNTPTRAVDCTSAITNEGAPGETIDCSSEKTALTAVNITVENLVEYNATDLVDDLPKNAQNSEVEEVVELIVDTASYIDFIFDEISSQIIRLNLSQPQKDMNFSFDDSFHSIKICETDKNGNSLFFAIGHQLFEPNMLSEEHSNLSYQLRTDVVGHIKDNMDSFHEDIKNRLSEEFGKNGKIDIANFLTQLSNDGFFGGTETFRAVTAMYKVNIIVVTEGGDINYPIGYNNYNRALLLAYRPTAKRNNEGNVRQHYDSVVAIEPDIIFIIAKLLSDRLLQSTNL